MIIIINFRALSFTQEAPQDHLLQPLYCYLFHQARPPTHCVVNYVFSCHKGVKGPSPGNHLHALLLARRWGLPLGQDRGYDVKRQHIGHVRLCNDATSAYWFGYVSILVRLRQHIGSATSAYWFGYVSIIIGQGPVAISCNVQRQHIECETEEMRGSTQYYHLCFIVTSVMKHCYVTEDKGLLLDKT